MRPGRIALLLLVLLPPPAAAGVPGDLETFVDALAGLRRITVATLRVARPGDPGFTANGLEIELPGSPEKGYRLQLARLADNARPPRFAALRLGFEAVPAPTVLRLSGNLEIPGTPVRIGLEGRHDPATGAGVLRIDGGRIVFSAGGLQPAALSPRLGDRLRAVVGSIGFFARVEWGPASRQLAEVAIENLSFELAGIPMTGIAGRIAFDRLLPPATLPGQELTIERVGAAPALERGRIRFSLADGTRLTVHRLEFAIAGGGLRARPFRLDLARPRGSVTLHLEDLALEVLLARAGLPGLSGEGVLDGRLVARLAPGTVVIEEGELAARGPGRLRYAPEEPPPLSDPRMVMLLEAIRNFHFTRLAVNVAGDLLDELRLTIGLSGSNPDFYEGYPVALNLSFEGPLGALLGAGIRTYRLPAEIQRRLQQQRPR